MHLHFHDFSDQGNKPEDMAIYERSLVVSYPDSQEGTSIYRIKYWCGDIPMFTFEMAHPTLLEIEGLLFPGFGGTQAHKLRVLHIKWPHEHTKKIHLKSSILSALMTSLDGKNRFAMQLFSWKICAPALAQTPGMANLLFQVTLGPSLSKSQMSRWDFFHKPIF